MPLITSLKARSRAIALLATVLDAPVAGRAVEVTTREPRVEAVEIDGVPIEVVRPPDAAVRPAFVFVNGAHPLRRKEPVVQRLSRGLARVGFVVVVPDLPGLGEGEITAELPEAAARVTRYAADRQDVRGGRVALVGASTGASLAIIVAGRPELAARVSVVAAVAPFASLEKMICLATTRFYGDGGRFVPYDVSDLSRRIVARSLVAALECDDREALLEALERMEREGVDPLEALPRREGMSPKAQSVVRLLANRDPACFGALCEELPREVGSLFKSLAPLEARPRAPVEIVVPPDDPYFPLAEARALATALPTARLTITRTLDHTRPGVSPETLADFARFHEFVVRSLAAADS